MIKVEHLTKDYGHGRGVFDVTFDVKKGEVFGFLGPNGAGKTTTIRHIMGFSRPQAGRASVDGLDSREKRCDIQKNLGYLPGEIALPEWQTGAQFIKMMAGLRRMDDMSRANELAEHFSLDVSAALKRMSPGEKRKLAIVAAFMHDPDIYVLDEPTSGLDPLMQDAFIRFIREQKERGKTILLSSHIFAEVDATCDRIAIIKDGRLVSTFVANELRHNENKTFKIEFASREDYDRFLSRAPKHGFIRLTGEKPRYNQVKASVNDRDINELVAELAEYSLNFFTEIRFTLEDYFMRYYAKSAEGGAENAGN